VNTLFGKSEVSKIGLGTWQLGLKGWGSDYEEKELIEALRFGIENKLNFIDTAEIYGNGRSESIIGEAVSVFDRKEYYIATKVAGFNASAGRVRKSLTRSLKRLKCDFVDLYQVHWEPSAYTNMLELFKELEKAAKDGLINHIGVSNFSVRSIESANEAMKELKIESNQIKFNIIERPSSKLLEFMNRNNIKLIAWSPLAQGFLTGKYSETNLPSGYVRRINRLFSASNFERFKPLISKLKIISETRNVSPVQIVLAYEKHVGVLPIPGFRNKRQVAEIFPAISLNLSEHEVGSIEDALLKSGIIETPGSFYPKFLPNFIARIGSLFI
jgi:aryl-alcohol dehydrogenase-like predicted oxidoreductase